MCAVVTALEAFMTLKCHDEVVRSMAIARRPSAEVPVTNAKTVDAKSFAQTLA
jgi:hypothetical protein